jgi:hypothetical protein
LVVESKALLQRPGPELQRIGTFLGVEIPASATTPRQIHTRRNVDYGCDFTDDDRRYLGDLFADDQNHLAELLPLLGN